MIRWVPTAVLFLAALVFAALGHVVWAVVCGFAAVLDVLTAP